MFFFTYSCSHAALLWIDIPFLKLEIFELSYFVWFYEAATSDFKIQFLIVHTSTSLKGRND